MFKLLLITVAAAALICAAACGLETGPPGAIVGVPKGAPPYGDGFGGGRG